MIHTRAPAFMVYGPKIVSIFMYVMKHRQLIEVVYLDSYSRAVAMYTLVNPACHTPTPLVLKNFKQDWMAGINDVIYQLHNAIHIKLFFYLLSIITKGIMHTLLRNVWMH